MSYSEIPYLPRGNYTVSSLRSPPTAPDLIPDPQFNYPYGPPPLQRAGTDYEIGATSPDFPRWGGTLTYRRNYVGGFSRTLPYRSPSDVPGYIYTYSPGANIFDGTVAPSRLFGSGPNGWTGFILEYPEQETYRK